jgi:tetratricopeptide (TPR) repeat protein
LRRTRLHRQVATAIEELHPENYERLAYHWGEAGDEEKGLAYTIKAAERAQQAYANEDAARLYTEAISLHAEDDVDRFALLESRAAVYDVMAERDSQLADIEVMLAIANEEGDDSRRVDALLGLASLYLETEPTKAGKPLEQALEIAKELGDFGREGRALYLYGRHAFFLNDNFKAYEYFKTSANRLEQADLINEMAESLSFLSVTLGNMGDQPAALKAALEAADLSKGTGDKLLEALSLRRVAIAYMAQYKNSQALPIAEAALQMFHKVGDISNEVHALNVLGIIKRRLGMIEAAEEDLLNGLGIAESIGNEVGIKWLIYNLSYVYNWFSGEYTRTMALIEDQEEKAHQVENKSFEMDLLLMKVDELTRLGRYETAFSICETIIPFIDESDIVYKGWNLRRISFLNAELGRFDQAFQYLDEVGELFSRINNPFENTDLEFSTARMRFMKGEVQNLLLGIEKITDVVAFFREKNLTEDLGASLYVKAQLHLALLGDDQIHRESALKCTEEALECFEKEEDNLFMPEEIHLLHSRALRVNGKEKDADEYLRKAYERVMMVAENISDQDLRRSYLENVRDIRAIQAEFQERFG